MNNYRQITIVFLLLMFCNIYKSQSIRVLYEIDFKPSKQDSAREKELMLLLINTDDKKSLFQSYGNYQIDSINYALGSIKSIEEQMSFMKNAKNFSPQKSSFKYKITKDLKNNSFSWTEDINYRSYQQDLPATETKWKLEKDKKTIEGYVCKKAKTSFGGRDWIAYYTDEISILDGPYKFGGLPGLILEIKSTDNDYAFRLKSLKKEKSKCNIDLKKSTVVNQAQFLKIKTDYLKDPAINFRGTKSNSGYSASASFNGQEITTSNRDMIKQIEEESANWQKKHDNPLEKGNVWIN